MRPLLRTATLCAIGLATLADAPAPPDGIVVTAIDRSVDPCDDFYHFACNGWIKANPIPPDQAEWDVGGPLAERNLARLRDILEKAAAGSDPDTRKLGDYWTACMDEAGIETRGLAPLRPSLDAIDALADKAALAPLLARLHGGGVDAFFVFSSSQDGADATQVIAEADQGGLGLPDRDYYTKTDADSERTRRQYRDHLTRIGRLAGIADPEAAAVAAIRLETRLARASLTREERIDPRATYHRMALADLAGIAAGFAWLDYLKALGAPAIASLTVAEPDFFKALGPTLAATPIEDIRTYLRFRVIETAAPLLPRSFAEESFDFHDRWLRGLREDRPRWKRCVAAADEDLGEALGRLYVRDLFPPAAKARVTAMIADIKAAFAENLKTIPWMGAETRARAEAKLARMVDKVGYPDRWRDYSGLEIRRDDLVGNRFRAARFELARELAKIGRPVDRDEWAMTPPTVDAYYDPQRNDINFPAGMLQQPYFDLAWDDAVNYGSIGAAIGHEMTHGFDNAGRMYDGDGNLRDWWTEADARQFETRAQCLVREYGGFTTPDGLHLKGDVTLGENTADNGGTRLAWLAFERAQAAHPDAPRDGLTPPQRFFVAYAQSWCTNETREAARLQALSDPHAPAEARVNGVVRNMPEFRDAFVCKAGAPLAPKAMCRVW